MERLRTFRRLKEKPHGLHHSAKLVNVELIRKTDHEHLLKLPEPLHLFSSLCRETACHDPPIVLVGYALHTPLIEKAIDHAGGRRKARAQVISDLGHPLVFVPQECQGPQLGNREINLRQVVARMTPYLDVKLLKQPYKPVREISFGGLQRLTLII